MHEEKPVRAPRRRERGPGRVQDFENDIPSELVVEDGLDAFALRGRYLLFIDLIGSVADDITIGVGTEYQDAMMWVNDPANIQAWLSLIGASPEVSAVLQDALLNRAPQLKEACVNASRSYSRNGGEFVRFLERLGVESLSGRSSTAQCMDAMDDDTHFPTFS